MEGLVCFAWGVVGGFLAEVSDLYLLTRVGAREGKRWLPREYRQAWWLLGRSLMVVAAGVMTYALEAPSPLVAIWIGATTPAILIRLRQLSPAGEMLP